MLWAARWGIVATLALALVVWLAGAIGLYFVVALVYRREPSPP